MIRRFAVAVPWFGVFIVLAGAFYAFRYSQFVPTPLGMNFALGLAGVVAFGAGIVSYRRTSLDNVLIKGVTAAAMALIFFGLSYEAFVAGLPTWYAYEFGRFGEQVVMVSDWRRSSPWHCSGPNIKGGLFLPPTLCLDYQQSARAPPGRVIMLFGPATVFGINVKYVFRQ
jgi:hypothetical protein